jgi:hypothetical protein
MRTVEELREFYTNKLAAQLQRLEQERLRRVRMMIFGAALGAVIYVGILIVAAAMHAMYPPVFIFGIIICGVIAVGVGSIGSMGYVSDFKAAIIMPLVKFVDEALEYNPYSYIPEDAFIRSRMFSPKPDRYKGDDLVTGKLGATQVAFSGVHAEYMTTTTDGKGHTQTQWHTIFKGLFFVGDFNKDFQRTTVVLPDYAEKFLGKWGQMLQGMTFLSDLKLVKLEDPQFEHEFVVYSQDQIEARYILSTSLMQRIVKFKADTGKDISLSFVGSKVFVAVPHTEDMFEPRLFRTLLDFEIVRQYFENLNIGVEVVEDLNLNTRIWSKE